MLEIINSAVWGKLAEALVKISRPKVLANDSSDDMAPEAISMTGHE